MTTQDSQIMYKTHDQITVYLQNVRKKKNVRHSKFKTTISIKQKKQQQKYLVRKLQCRFL